MADYFGKYVPPTKDEEEKAWRYKTEGFSTMYEEDDEEDLYETATIMRKESGLSSAPYKENKPETYKNLIINKPVENTPASETYATYWRGSTLPNKEITDEDIGFTEVWWKLKSSEDFTVKDSVTKLFEEQIKEWTWKVLKWVAQVMDKPVDTAISKPFGSLYTIWAAWYFNTKEMYKSMVEFRDFDWMKAWKDTEAFQDRIEYLFWTNLSMNDYLNMDTAQEKRRKIVEKSDWELRNDLEKLEPYTIVYDVVANLLTMWWISKWLGQLALKAWPKTAVGKTMIALENTINPSLTNMAKLGVWVAAVAWPYYGLTWKWLWEDDPQATEWALMFLTSLWIKLSPKAVKWGYKAWKKAYDLGKWWIKALFRNKEVQKWVQMFSEEFKKLTFEWVEKFAKFSWAKLPIVEEWFTKSVKEWAKVDPIKGASEAALVKRMREESIKRARKKPIKEWFIEKRAKDLKMWDPKKGSLANTFDYIYNRSASKIYENQNRLFGQSVGDKSVNWKLSPAIKKVENDLDVAQTFNKADNIKGDFNRIVKEAWGDFEDFNQYLWEKSRYNKAISQAGRWKAFSTVQNFENWAKMDWTPERLKMSIAEREWKYEELAKIAERPNNQVLDLEIEAWMRTPEEVAAFKKNNPVYVPDKWDVAVIETAVKNDDNWRLVKMGQKLWEWTEDVDLSKNALENLAKNLAYRTKVATRSKLVNTMLEYGEDLGIAKIVPEDKVTERWWAIVEAFQNGKKIYVEVPAYYKEALDKNDAGAISLLSTIAQTPSRILKTMAVSANIAFQVGAPAYEAPMAAMKNWLNWWNMVDYIKSMVLASTNTSKFAKWTSYMGTPEGKIAMHAMLKEHWGDFTRTKLFEREFWEFLWVEDINKVGKIREWSLKTHKLYNALWHIIEKNTTRLPTFEAQLKKKGLSAPDFQKIAKKYVVDWQTDVKGLTNELKWLWADAQDASRVARSIMDYASASKAINDISKFIPYLNTALSSNLAMKKMFDDNPRKFIVWVLGGSTAIAEIMYQYNYSGERWDALRKQSAFKRTQAWFASLDEENWEMSFYKVLSKVPPIKWIYPMVVDLHENGGIGKMGLNPLFQDLTYGGDLEKPLWVDPSKLPPWLKQVLEVTLNKDFFRDKDLVSDYDKRQGTEQYTKYTNPLYIKLSKAWALITWWEVSESWVIEWGQQPSPIKLEKFFETFDPTWVLSDTAALALNKISDVWVSETNVKWPIARITGVFKKAYKLQELTSEEDIATEEGFAEQSFKADHRQRIRTRLEEMKSMGEYKEGVQELIKEYKSYEFYESDYKKILKEELKDKEIKLKYWTNYFFFTGMSADKIGQRFARILQDEWLEKMKKQFYKLKGTWILSDSKIANIKKELKRIAKKNKIPLK